MWYKEGALFKLQQYTLILYKLGLFSDEEKTDILQKINGYKNRMGLKE